MNLGVGLLLALPAPLLTWLVWRRVSASRPLVGGVVLAIAAAGAGLGALALYGQHLLLGWTSLSLRVDGGNTGTAALATFLLIAPLHEATKVGCVWPLYATGRLLSPRTGLLYGVAAGAGLGVAEAVALSLTLPGGFYSWALILLGLPVQLFAPGLWGYWLGRGERPRGRWFAVAWTVAVGVHGLYALLVFSGSPKLALSALPLALTMAVAGWMALRDMEPSVDSARDAPVRSERGRLLRALPEPPSLSAMRRALRRSDRPIMLHWILMGGLVTIGVMIVSLGAAVWLGHELAIDFSHAESSGVEAGAPLLLLGSALLVSFPLAGFLVAKASAASSVLEPALGACIAIVLLALALAVSTSSGVLMSLGLAPVAFTLSCLGAWFGTSS